MQYQKQSPISSFTLNTEASFSQLSEFLNNLLNSIAQKTGVPIPHFNSEDILSANVEKLNKNYKLTLHFRDNSHLTITQTENGFIISYKNKDIIFDGKNLYLAQH